MSETWRKLPIDVQRIPQLEPRLEIINICMDCKNLKNSNKVLRAENENLKKSLQSEKEKSKEVTTKLWTKVQEFTATLEYLETEKAKLEKEHDEMRQELDQVKNSLSSAKKIEVELENQLTGLHIDFEKVIQEKDQIVAEHTRKKNFFQDQISGFYIEKKSLMDEIKELKNENQNLHKIIDYGTETLEKDRKEQAQSVEEFIHKGHKFLSTIGQLKQENTELQGKLDELIQGHKKELQEKDRLKDHLIQDKAVLKTQVKKVQAENSDLKRSLENIKTENQNLQAVVENFKNVENESQNSLICQHDNLKSEFDKQYETLKLEFEKYLFEKTSEIIELKNRLREESTAEKHTPMVNCENCFFVETMNSQTTAQLDRLNYEKTSLENSLAKIMAENKNLKNTAMFVAVENVFEQAKNPKFYQGYRMKTRGAKKALDIERVARDVTLKVIASQTQEIYHENIELRQRIMQMMSTMRERKCLECCKRAQKSSRMIEQDIFADLDINQLLNDTVAVNSPLDSCQILD